MSGDRPWGWLQQLNVHWRREKGQSKGAFPEVSLPPETVSGPTQPRRR